jgi:hypothetical protein
MKTVFLRSLLAVGFGLAIGNVQAGMQFAGGGSAQQTFNGRGYGFEGRPTSEAQFTQTGHSAFHTEQFSNQRQGDFHSAPAFVRRTSFDHNHFGHHRHFIVIFANGSPFWYLADTDYPYYNDTAPPVVSSSAVDTTDSDGISPSDSNATNPGNAQPSSDYGDLGASWGQDLRREVATWNQFVGYLKSYIIMAAPADQAEFREAFIDAYRLNGPAAYDKAAVEAAGGPVPSSPGPKIITISPPNG